MKLTKGNVSYPQNQPSRKTISPLILIIAIVLVIAAVIVAITFLSTNNNDSQVSENLTSNGGVSPSLQSEASQSTQSMASSNEGSSDAEASKSANEIRAEKYDGKTNLLAFIDGEMPDYTSTERFALSLTANNKTVTADLPLIDGYKLENAMGTSYIEYYLNLTSSMTTNDLVIGKLQIIYGDTVHSDYEWYQNEGCYVEEKTISANTGNISALLIWEGEYNGYYRQLMYRAAVPLADGYYLAFSAESLSPDYDEEVLYTIKYMADNLIVSVS